jgi:DNA-binding GntR family transcriptional regulator
MTMGESFEDRMFMEGQAVYAAIERGEMAGPAAVESALMDGLVRASGGDDQD